MIKVTTGKKTKTVRKTSRPRKGYSSRISVTAAAAADAKVDADRQAQVRQALGHPRLRQRRRSSTAAG